MSEKLRPTAAGVRISDWCKRLFENNPDAIEPIFQSVCVHHGQAIAMISTYQAGIGRVRIAVLHTSEEGHCYQVYFDGLSPMRYFTIFADGRAWGRDDDGVDHSVDAALMALLETLIIVPCGLFGYIEDDSVKALINYAIIDGRLACGVYALSGSVIPSTIAKINIQSFWRLHRAGSIVQLMSTFAKGTLWDIRIPAHLLGIHRAALLQESGLPAVHWEGPALNGLPERATYTFVGSYDGCAAAVTWPPNPQFDLIGSSLRDYHQSWTERRLLAEGML